MKKRFMAALLAAFCACHAFADLDYAQLSGSLSELCKDKTLTAGLANILAAAKSDDGDEVVARCMALYALRAGTLGNVRLCQGACQSLFQRQPNSAAARYVKSLSIFIDPCVRCGGIGGIEAATEARCFSCGGSGKCPRCGGAGKIEWPALVGPAPEKAKPRLFACPVCGGTGKCRACLGSPLHLAKPFARCPECRGVAKGIDRIRAASGFAQMASELAEILKETIACNSKYQAAMALKDPAAQIKALAECAAAHPKSVTLRGVQETLKDVQDAFAAAKRKADEERQRLAEKHRLVLDDVHAIAESGSASAALAKLEEFTRKNPGSPLIKEAGSLMSELVEKAAAETKKKERIRLTWQIGAALLGFFFLTWLYSFIKDTFFRKEVIHVRRPRQSDVDANSVSADAKVAFNSDLHSFVAEQLTATLAAATEATPQDQRVICPDCGAELECPPNIRNQTVTCSACSRKFKVR